MKLELTMYGDDVTALVQAIDALRDKVAIGITIGSGATDEWAYNYNLYAHDTGVKSWLDY